MRLTLLVPGLLLPEAVLVDTVFDLKAPALSLLLGRGQRVAADPDWLAGAFGLPAPLPAAALRKVGRGETAEGLWMCLDPVHWQVAREGISLADPAQLSLTAAEAAALFAAAQPLLAEWGELLAGSPRHWELQLSCSLLLETRPLADCIGLPVDPGLPAGLDGVKWRHLLVEMQTVLHAHKINRQREALGQPTISSLWPWGAGSLPQQVRTAFDVAWADDAVLDGLCALAGIPCITPPVRFQPASGNVLCRVDGLAGPARMHDGLAWREALMALERDWIAPAVAALKHGECQSLRVVGTSVHGAPRAALYSLVRGNLWRFWRRPCILSALQ